MTDNKHKQKFTGHDFPYDRPKIENESYVSMEEWRAPLDNWEKQLKRDKRKRLLINVFCFILGMVIMNLIIIWL